ncbi:hypothetical protein [Abyssibacter profundi]|nr:hypothetical protein [Abyssibacter profundi]
MTTLADIDAEIALVNASIARTLQAVEMGKGNRRERREALAELRAHRQYLRTQRAQLQRGGAISVQLADFSGQGT